MIYASFTVLGIVILAQAYFLVKFARVIFNFEEKIESSLDSIDQSYKAISEILERPLFFDSPEVRSVLNEIKNVETALLEVAQDIARVSNEEE